MCVLKISELAPCEQNIVYSTFTQLDTALMAM